MQSRQPPLPAPGPRGPRRVAPLLALLLLLALQGARAAPAGPWLQEEVHEWFQLWQRQGGILDDAAQVALHFLNFREGSLSALRMPSRLLGGSAWVTSRKEYQTQTSFATKRYNLKEGKEEPFGECSAHVIFKKEKPRAAVNITCARVLEQSQQQQEDYVFYRQLKQLENPVGAVRIPEKFGHIDPTLRPMWELALLGSSYMIWDKTTHILRFQLSQLISVNQWKTDDDTIDFDYTVLLYEFSTQETIPCRIHLVWYPGKPLKVKYHCQEQQTPDKTPGTEEGSAVAPTELSNF